MINREYKITLMNKESHTILTCSHNFATILYSEYHNRDVNQTYRI